MEIFFAQFTNVLGLDLVGLDEKKAVSDKAKLKLSEEIVKQVFRTNVSFDNNLLTEKEKVHAEYINLQKELQDQGSQSFDPKSSKDLDRVISSLDPKKAPGLDKISNKLLKYTYISIKFLFCNCLIIF